MDVWNAHIFCTFVRLFFLRHRWKFGDTGNVSALTMLYGTPLFDLILCCALLVQAKRNRLVLSMEQEVMMHGSCMLTVKVTPTKKKRPNATLVYIAELLA